MQIYAKSLGTIDLNLLLDMLINKAIDYSSFRLSG